MNQLKKLKDKKNGLDAFITFCTMIYIIISILSILKIVKNRTLIISSTVWVVLIIIRLSILVLEMPSSNCKKKLQPVKIKK